MQHPLKFAEEFTVEIRLAKLRPFSVQFEYEITNGEGKVCCLCSSLNVCIDKERAKLSRIPEWIKERIAAMKSICKE